MAGGGGFPLYSQFYGMENLRDNHVFGGGAVGGYIALEPWLTTMQNWKFCNYSQSNISHAKKKIKFEGLLNVK